jgi:integrase
VRVGDVDVSGRRIRVRRSITYVRKTGLVEGPTKNHTARTVPVPAFLARLLGTEIAGRDADALVFASMGGGGHLTLGQARYTFQKAVAAVDGCAGVRLHDLRRPQPSFRSSCAVSACLGSTQCYAPSIAVAPSGTDSLPICGPQPSMTLRPRKFR